MSKIKAYIKERIFCKATIIQAIFLLLVFSGVLLFETQFHHYRIEGASMQPTYHTGEVVYAKKVQYDGYLKTGNIVCYVLDANNHDSRVDGHTGAMIIKRITHIPGETVYDAETGTELLTLAEDEYYLEGDNPDASFDSRYYGPVKRSEIKCAIIAGPFPYWFHITVTCAVFLISILVVDLIDTIWGTKKKNTKKAS